MSVNKIKKNITVIFLKIDANECFFKSFSSHIKTIYHDNDKTRIINHRGKKYLIKFNGFNKDNSERKPLSYSLTVVRERNTWQTKATKDGIITGINQNQGIIGDPYFFYIVPDLNVILGFTSGPSGTVKSVSRFVLEQFNSDRKNKIGIDLIPKEKEFSSLNELPEFSSLQFNMNSSYLNDLSEDAPNFFKQLSSAPYIGQEMQLSFNLEFGENKESNLTKENVIEIVNFLSDHEGCSILKVKGVDKKGSILSFDFSNAFLNFKTEINTRNKFIDEECSSRVLESALDDYLLKISYD
ncbi:hypothetical protein [Hafnia sp. HMSC23F03]|uniref:hypothetical protein n=1 Tax=Hafnia sp. HMSC23F03 TaxID=1581059 RepID=UPI0008A38EC5|nr:hypothetical protein [Hafnia sp. HMSC23F03]OFS11932.1 hypothetical protein HMPREF3091_04075 [Hafnia sp. HMSC23F03]